MRRQFSTTALAGLLLSTAILPLNGWSGMMEMKEGEKTIEEVKLASEGTLLSGEKRIVLKPYVSGLRKKKVALFWAKVYVGQIFSTPGLTAPKTIPEALETLSKQPVVAIRLTFKRDVSIDRMKDAFKDSLKQNDIDPDSEAMKPLFQAIEKSGGMKDKETTTIVLERAPNGDEAFRFENGKGEVQSSKVETGTIRKILTMWVGKPADSGVERMQDQFIGKED